MIYQGNNGWGSSREYLQDVLAIASFIIGMANYGENLDQRSAQELLNQQSNDIHAHLKMQDEKIDRILKMLEGREEDAV